MKEELSDSALEALYGASTKPAPPPLPQREGAHRRHHHYHRSAKPFAEEKTYKPYVLVGAVSLLLVLMIFLVSK